MLAVVTHQHQRLSESVAMAAIPDLVLSGGRVIDPETAFDSVTNVVISNG
jgi:hypothetical protein